MTDNASFNSQKNCPTGEVDNNNTSEKKNVYEKVNDHQNENTTVS